MELLDGLLHLHQTLREAVENSKKISLAKLQQVREAVELLSNCVWPVWFKQLALGSSADIRNLLKQTPHDNQV